MLIYDITRPVHPALAVWPGDATYNVTSVLRIGDGASVNLTTLSLSPHTGTHADAYFHYEEDGVHPAQMPLEAYIGRAYVQTVMKQAGALLPEDFPPEMPSTIERLLIHSHVSDLPDAIFPTEFPYLSVELIAWLAERGTRLIGLDSPSVDALESKTLPCHHALRAHGMVNLETLQLRGVPDGMYELVALPLRLDLACGSPVRAILREI
jgi:arylformamidase